MSVEHLLWVEKYRPRKVADCILIPELQKIFSGMVADGKVTNLLLSGPPGSGKTTVAKALCEELGYDYLFINASLQRGIDVIREDIINHASTVSIDGSRKFIILDEADNLTGDAQDALRGCIEQFAKTCGFILTCNFKNKLKDPLHSRFSHIDFKLTKEEKKILLPEIVKHCFGILEMEGVEHNRKVVMQVVANFFPDFRRTINELQKYSKINRKIDEGILVQNVEGNLSLLYRAMKEKKYQDVRLWVTSNNDNDSITLYRKFFEGMDKHIQPKSVPQAVIHLGNYMYRNSFVADSEINFLSFVTEVMRDCEFV
jgi:DNA polymerase III delta prime subunit